MSGSMPAAVDDYSPISQELTGDVPPSPAERDDSPRPAGTRLRDRGA